MDNKIIAKFVNRLEGIRGVGRNFKLGMSEIDTNCTSYIKGTLGAEILEVWGLGYHINVPEEPLTLPLPN